MMGKGWKSRQKAFAKGIKEKFEGATAETKAQVGIYASNYQAAKNFRKDKGAVNWWDSHCKGLMTENALAEIKRGFAAKEITAYQGNLMLRTMETAGYITMEDEDWF